MSEPMKPAQEGTPRTEAQLAKSYEPYKLDAEWEYVLEVPADFARTLERELAEAREWADAAQVARQELIKAAEREIIRVQALHHGLMTEADHRVEAAERELAEANRTLNDLQLSHTAIRDGLALVHENYERLEDRAEAAEQALEKEKHQRAEDEAQYALDLQRERDEAYERAARECEAWAYGNYPPHLGYTDKHRRDCLHLAATIRALSKPQDTEHGHV